MKYKNYHEANPHPSDTIAYKAVFAQSPASYATSLTNGTSAYPVTGDSADEGEVGEATLREVNAQNKVVDLKILWVLDGIISFDNQSHGLSLVYESLMKRLPCWLNVNLWILNRPLSDDSAASESDNPFVVSGKVFQRHGLLTRELLFDSDIGFDEIWFFSSETDESKGLTDHEICLMWRFMNQGGGVFAVGDHGEIGKPVCGKIPRVSQMLHYHYRNSPQPDAGANKNNSTQRMEASDLIDQGIQTGQGPLDLKCRFYRDYHLMEPRGERLANNPLLLLPRFALPHPVLAAPGFDMPVSVLPAHIHEGEVVPPPKEDELNGLTFSCNCSSTHGPSGAQPLFPNGLVPWAGKARNALPWEIIGATDNYSEKNLVARMYEDFNQTSSPKSEFGVVGAYNGHLANAAGPNEMPCSVGRIVVDSSYHHWINQNLRPFFPNPEPATLNEPETVRLMRAYRHGILFWLVPKNRQCELATAAVWHAVNDSPMRDYLPVDFDEYFDNYLMYGQLLLKFLEPVYPHVMMRNWWCSFLETSDLAELLHEEAGIEETTSEPLTVDFQWDILDECMLGALVRVCWLEVNDENDPEIGVLIRRIKEDVKVAAKEYMRSFLGQRFHQLGILIGRFQAFSQR